MKVDQVVVDHAGKVQPTVRAVIHGQVVTGKELLQAFREMPESDRKSLLEDLILLDAP